jgi:hypothetical protein
MTAAVLLRSIDAAPAELADAVREFFPPEEWDHAGSISWLESGWNAFAHNDSTHGGAIPCGTVLYVRDGVEVTAENSISWFQLNACNFPTWNWWDFFNTRHNVGTAHLLWVARGWQPWYFSAKALGLL